MDAIAISRSALDVEWRRIELSAQNLANMNSTRGADGRVYQALRLVSGPAGDFSAMLNGGVAEPAGVRVIGVEPVPGGPRRVFDPDHPHAGADGFVEYPNVDHAGEMTAMIRASRAYEANLAAIAIVQGMYASALEIGRRS